MSTALLSDAEMTLRQSIRPPPGLTTFDSSVEALQAGVLYYIMLYYVTLDSILFYHNTCFEVQPLPTKNISKMGKQGRRGSKSRWVNKAGDGSDRRWWTRSHQHLMCPLTNFPIQLLPYPLFKLCTEPSKRSPGPYTLVDGKSLALQLIVNGRSGPGIRELLPSDLTSLDGYIRRCKLGPFRPGEARSLAEEMQTAPTEAERQRAGQELQKLRAKTRSEMVKLRRIQEKRLAQLKVPEEHFSETPQESPKEVEIPTSRFFGPQVKDMELKRLQL